MTIEEVMTDLMIPDISDDIHWQNIINELVDNLEIDKNEIPDKVIEAAELMVSGVPTYKIARQLNVKTNVVKNWLSKYPTMAKAVALAKQNLQKWRMQQLESQFILAVKKSSDVLSAESEILLDENGNIVFDKNGNPAMLEPNAKLLGVQAQHARFLISLFLGNKLDINVTVKDETPVMKAKADALDYIVDKLKDLHDTQEPRETVVIIQEPNKNTGPLLTEDDKPRFGEIGKLYTNEEGETQCHICGRYFKQLEIHVRTKHSLSNDMYETVFVLPPGALKDAAKVDTRGTGGPSEA